MRAEEKYIHGHSVGRAEARWLHTNIATDLSAVQDT